MRITYATTYDPADVKAWSGTVYFIAKALLDQGVELEMLGELGKGRMLVNKAVNKLSKLSPLGEMFPVERTERMADVFAMDIRRHLMTSRSDVLFSPGSIPMALVRTKRPKVFYTDATFAGILGMYPEFSTYPKRYIKEGHQLEQAALSNCDMAIYCSAWAARTAMEHYDVDERRVRVVPLGGNLMDEPAAADVEQAVRSRDTAVCELLFMGVAWERKGGPKALEAARILHEQGVPVRLHLVGSAPDTKELPSYVVDHGFISKGTPEGNAAFNALFRKAHFLVLPTMAECYGLVLCEASAHGVPALVNNVGGTSEVVHQGLNGELFPMEAPASVWAERIAALFTDRAGYQQLARTSRRAYDERLNWRVAGSALRGLLEELV